jgi:predicted component of type VI protein secretion system
MHERETTAIPKLVLSTTLRVLRRIVVDRARMSIGRRPYNDIMLDDLTVSGEHAVLHTGAGECVIHDLHSRNGTLVNGLPVMQRVLVDGDRIEIGIYRLDFVIERVVADPVAADRADGLSAGSQSGTAGLRVLSGSNAGATLALDRQHRQRRGSGGGARPTAQRSLCDAPRGPRLSARQRRVDRPGRPPAAARRPDRAGRNDLPVLHRSAFLRPRWHCATSFR